jgi:hypothetical protein
MENETGGIGGEVVQSVPARIHRLVQVVAFWEEPILQTAPQEPPHRELVKEEPGWNTGARRSCSSTYGLMIAKVIRVCWRARRWAPELMGRRPGIALQ